MSLYTLENIEYYMISFIFENIVPMFISFKW